MSTSEKTFPVVENVLNPASSETNVVVAQGQDSQQKQRFENCLSRHKQDKHYPEYVEFSEASEERNKILRIIVILLQTSNPRLDWHKNRPHIHRRLEEALFYEKESLEEYIDVQTVQQRVFEHVSLVGQKVPHMELTAPPSSEAGSVHSMPPLQALKIKQSRNRTPEELLRQQQQRLLLLQHVMECPVTDAECPTTPLCASMKKVWQHIIYCKAPQCTFPHCKSSRYVLSHHCDCKNSSCRMCAPLREGRGLEWFDLPWTDTASSAASASTFSARPARPVSTRGGSGSLRTGRLQGISGEKADTSTQRGARAHPGENTPTTEVVVAPKRGRPRKYSIESEKSSPDSTLKTPKRAANTERSYARPTKKSKPETPAEARLITKLFAPLLKQILAEPGDRPAHGSGHRAGSPCPLRIPAPARLARRCRSDLPERTHIQPFQLAGLYGGQEDAEQVSLG